MKKLYYIKRINNDQCTLSTASGTETEVVNVENLLEFSKNNVVVVGFNRVTGKLSVSSEREAVMFFKSKLKLSGVDTEDFSFKRDENSAEFSIATLYSVSNRMELHSTFEYQKDKNRLVLTATDKAKNYGYDFTSIVDTIIVHWMIPSSEENSELFQMLEKCEVELQIILDIGSYRHLVGVVDTYDMNNSNLRLSKIDVVNKNTFSKADHILNLFDFTELSEDTIWSQSMMKGTPVKDFSLDLTDYKFKELVTNRLTGEKEFKVVMKEVFGNLRNVKLPEYCYYCSSVQDEHLFLECSFDELTAFEPLTLLPTQYLIKVDSLRYSIANTIKTSSEGSMWGTIGCFVFDKLMIETPRKVANICVGEDTFVITATDLKEYLGEEQYNIVKEISKYGIVKKGNEYTYIELKNKAGHYSNFVKYFGENCKGKTVDNAEDTIDIARDYFGIRIDFEEKVKNLGKFSSVFNYYPSKKWYNIFTSLDEEETRAWLFVVNILLSHMLLEGVKVYPLDDLSKRYPDFNVTL